MGHNLVYVRRGAPSNSADLAMVSIVTARTIIILADAREGHEQGREKELEFVADSRTINTVLAVQSFSGQHGGRFKGKIVAELLNHKYKNRLKKIGGSLLESVTPRSIIPALMVKSSRQVGLSQLYKSLIGFEGSEFYLHNFEALTDLTFRQTQQVVLGAIVVGTKKINSPVLLNPPECYRLSAGEEIVALAEEFQDIQLDDELVRMFRSMQRGSSARARGMGLPAKHAPGRRCMQQHGSFRNMVVAGSPAGGRPEKMLLLGWRDDILDIIKHLDLRVSLGSQITIICELEASEQVRRLESEGLRWREGVRVDGDSITLERSTLHCYMADTTSERDMQALSVLHETVATMSVAERERRVMHPNPPPLRSASWRAAGGAGGVAVGGGEQNGARASDWTFPVWSEFNSTLIFSRDNSKDHADSDSVTDSETLMSMLLCREFQEGSFFKRVRHDAGVKVAAKTAHQAFASTLAMVEGGGGRVHKSAVATNNGAFSEETKGSVAEIISGGVANSYETTQPKQAGARRTKMTPRHLSSVDSMRGTERGPQRKDVFDNCKY